MHPRNFKLALARATIEFLARKIHITETGHAIYKVSRENLEKELADLIEQTIIEQGG